jgi:glycolate oxidase
MGDYADLAARDVKYLSGIVGKEHVSTAIEDLICHSYDATKQMALPKAVVRPAQAREVSAILAYANERRIPVYPMGAASGLTGGAVPVKGGIVLDMTRMNRIIEIDQENLVGVVEPGVICAEFQTAVERLGLFYPPDPASNEFSTLGGNVAECAGGLRCLKYGVTRDYVLALEAVLPSGQVIHTGSRAMKNVTGYDLTRLLVGSEGTLCVFTQITLRLIPLPKSIRTVLAYFGSFDDAAEAVSAIIAARIVPRAIEFMDEDTLMALRNYGEFDFPEEAKAALIVEVDGVEVATEREADAIATICRDKRCTMLSVALSAEDREELWKERRAISPALYNLAPKKINEDVCVPRNRLPDLIREIQRIKREKSVRIASFGHAGDGNVHVNFLIESDNPDELRRAEEGVEEMFRIVVGYGGSLSGEHGIGTTKAQYLGIEIPPHEMELMRQIKHLFDPRGILNPGKLFPASE